MGLVYGNNINRGNYQVEITGRGLVTFLFGYGTNLYAYVIGFDHLACGGEA